jgi:hypothetical protein
MGLFATAALVPDRPLPILRPVTPLRRQTGLLACGLVALALALAACSAPVKVERVSLRAAYEDLNRTALSSDELSEPTRTVLRRAALLDVFDTQPEAAIAALRSQAIATGMHCPTSMRYRK